MAHNFYEFFKSQVYELVGTSKSLKDVLTSLEQAKNRRIAIAAAEHDAAIAGVKHVLDAMPEALKVKAAADKEYAKKVKPIWDAYDTAVAKAKKRWDKVWAWKDDDQPDDEED